MATTTTTNLGLSLAVPGSNEPFDTADVNQNFEAIDSEVGARRSADTAQNSRLTAIEDLTLPTASGANVGVVPSGTAADRDGFWSVPATAADRVALANKGARWFNTEKGYEQQYFCQFDDASASRFNRQVHGWYPAVSLGLVPLKPTSTANTGGTVAVHGGRVNFTGVTTVALNGIFTADFDSYVLQIFSTELAANAQRLRLYAAGVEQAGAGTYAFQSHGMSGTGVAAVLNTGSPNWLLQHNANHELDATVRISFPLRATGRHLFRVESTSIATDGSLMQQSRLDGYHAATVACDGFGISVAAGTITGNVRVFGVNEY
ncbi:MAG TPA: hypothetical protein VIS29_06440 [Streptomyces sp.]|jgi:hypothetical protein